MIEHVNAIMIPLRCIQSMESMESRYLNDATIALKRYIGLVLECSAKNVKKIGVAKIMWQKGVGKNSIVVSLKDILSSTHHRNSSV